MDAEGKKKERKKDDGTCWTFRRNVKLMMTYEHNCRLLR